MKRTCKSFFTAAVAIAVFSYEGSLAYAKAQSYPDYVYSILLAVRNAAPKDNLFEINKDGFNRSHWNSQITSFVEELGKLQNASDAYNSDVETAKASRFIDQALEEYKVYLLHLQSLEDQLSKPNTKASSESIGLEMGRNQTVGREAVEKMLAVAGGAGEYAIAHFPADVIKNYVNRIDTDFPKARFYQENQTAQADPWVDKAAGFFRLTLTEKPKGKDTKR